MRSVSVATFVFASMISVGMAMNRHDPLEGDNMHMTTLVCERPAVLATCKKDCHCPGNSAQPDCGHPVCHDNCRCREATPPPAYHPPPPPYDDKKKGSSSPKGDKKKVKGHKRAEEWAA